MTTDAMTALEARMIAIDDERDRLEAEDNKLKSERAALEEQLIKQWQEAGKQRVRLNGRTLYLRRDLYVSAEKDAAGEARTQEVIAALDALELDEFVSETYSASRLAAWVREQPVDPKTLLPVLPTPLVGILKVSEKFSLRNTK